MSKEEPQREEAEKEMLAGHRCEIATSMKTVWSNSCEWDANAVSGFRTEDSFVVLAVSGSETVFSRGRYVLYVRSDVVRVVRESRMLNNAIGHSASFLHNGGERHCCGVQRYTKRRRH